MFIKTAQNRIRPRRRIEGIPATLPPFADDAERWDALPA
jgi:hypothetical protein